MQESRKINYSNPPRPLMIFEEQNLTQGELMEYKTFTNGLNRLTANINLKTPPSLDFICEMYAKIKLHSDFINRPYALVVHPDTFAMIKAQARSIYSDEKPYINQFMGIPIWSSFNVKKNIVKIAYSEEELREILRNE